MPLFSSHYDGCKARVSAAHENNGLPGSSLNLTSTSAHVAAWLFVGASVCIGSMYGYGFGEKYSLALGIVFAAAAVAGEISKPIAVSAIFDAVKHWHLGKAAAASVLALMCITYSLAADLALSSTLRGDIAAQRSANIDAVVAAKADRRRAEEELALLAVARPGAELAAQIVKLKATAGANNCEKVDGTVSRRVCGQVADLEAEAARDRRRQELASVIAKATTTIAAVPTEKKVGVADPLAASIASYATAAGRKIEEGDVWPWLALLLPLFVEVGSALGLVVAKGFDVVDASPQPARNSDGLTARPQARIEAVRNATTQEPSNAVPTTVGTPVPMPSVPLLPAVSQEVRGSVPACPRKAGADDGKGGDGPSNGARLGTALLTHLKANGGRVTAGQRGLAKLLDTSTTELNRTIHKLAAAGILSVAADRLSGTTLKLAS